MRKSVGQTPTAGEQTQQKPCRTSSGIGAEQENEWMDGWMGGWVDGWMVGCIDGWMVGWLDGSLDGWMDVWMDG
jgi:organic anion transporter 5A